MNVGPHRGPVVPCDRVRSGRKREAGQNHPARGTDGLQHQKESGGAARHGDHMRHLQLFGDGTLEFADGPAIGELPAGQDHVEASPHAVLCGYLDAGHGRPSGNIGSPPITAGIVRRLVVTVTGRGSSADLA